MGASLRGAEAHDKRLELATSTRALIAPKQPPMALSGDDFPMKLPAIRRLPIQFVFRLDVDHRSGCQPAIGFESLAGLSRKPQAEGRVEEDQIERGGRTVEKSLHIVSMNPAVGTQQFDIRLEDVDDDGSRFDERGRMRAARQRFQSQRAGAGIEIQHLLGADIERQPVEQGFAHPVRRWTQAGALGNRQCATTEFAADQTQLTGPPMR